MAWDYYKLPDNKLPVVKDLIAKGDAKKLILVHNTYKLSSYDYCCSTGGIFEHFKKLIDERENS